MTFIIGRGFAGCQILKKWKWPYLLNWVEYFDKLLRKHWYWQDLVQEIANWLFYQSRLCRSSNSEKVKIALSLELWRILWWNFACTLILTGCSQWDCQMTSGIGRDSNSETKWKWPYLLSLLACFDKFYIPITIGERGGSVVECRTPEREVRGSKPTAAVLCPWARHFTPRKYWLITQEAMAPSRHDWKIVDWDVKPQHNQPTHYYWHDLDRGIAKSSPRDCKMTFSIGHGCAELQILKKWKRPNWVDSCDETLHTQLILTSCSPRDCQMSFGIGRSVAEVQIPKKWNWPCLLKIFEYFDKITRKHCYWRELDRGIANCYKKN